MNQLEAIEFFGIKLANPALLTLLLVRYTINFLATFVLVRLIYFNNVPNKNYYFSFFITNNLIFLVCFLMGNTELSTGFGFGLFAIFSILRYRTDTLPVKEMTYLFAVIVLGVINAVGSKEIGFAEIFVANILIIALIWVMEYFWLEKYNASKNIVYEKIELIKPENRALLIEDLRKRTGLQVANVSIGKIDFLNDTAIIKIYYKEDKVHQEF